MPSNNPSGSLKAQILPPLIVEGWENSSFRFPRDFQGRKQNQELCALGSPPWPHAYHGAPSRAGINDEKRAWWSPRRAMPWLGSCRHTEPWMHSQESRMCSGTAGLGIRAQHKLLPCVLEQTPPWSCLGHSNALAFHTIPRERVWTVP